MIGSPGFTVSKVDIKARLKLSLMYQLPRGDHCTGLILFNGLDVRHQNALKAAFSDFVEKKAH